jgi:CheY-like chemotaxis protein
VPCELKRFKTNTTRRSLEQPLRIVAIDDSTTDLLLLEAAFTDAGIPCEWKRFSDVEQAIEYLRSPQCPLWEPDLVLTDYYMPKIDGVTLIERVRTGLPDTPFVLLTGPCASFDIGRADSAGTTLRLQKPMDYENWIALADQIAGIGLLEKHSGEQGRSAAA